MEWIKKNKLFSLVLVILAIIIVKDFVVLPNSAKTSSLPMPAFDSSASYGGGAVSKSVSSSIIPLREAAPVAQADRIVVEETSMSLVVLKVKETSDKISELAKTAGGYMVSTNISQPEEAPFASVVVRIPAEKVKSTIEEYRKLSIKVTSENVIGTDVTDQYVDLEARLKTLETTKTKFQEIMTRATIIQDILTVQRELINLQDQIDSLKGRQKYLEQTAALSKVTIYLSSDELALPYAPSEAFRPNVIFKLAVRSMTGALRGIAEKLIWIVVFSVIWVPVLIGIVLFRRWNKKRKTS
jgi:hypothetical protein